MRRFKIFTTTGLTSGHSVGGQGSTTCGVIEVGLVDVSYGRAVMYESLHLVLGWGMCEGIESRHDIWGYLLRIFDQRQELGVK